MSVTYTLHDVVRQPDLSSYISGAQRSNYFKRPLIPIASVQYHQEYSTINTNFKVDTRYSDRGDMREEIVIEPKTKTVEVQTMYRESEAQTDPYTPAYQLKKGDKPEVLALKHLTWGQGLPATMEELNWIENRRQKQAFDCALPPMSDEASFGVRTWLLKEQETKEWMQREKEIEEVQNEKLKTIVQALMQREKEVEEEHAMRIEDIKIKKTEQKNRLVAKLNKRKIKTLRALVKEKRQEEEEDKGPGRDIIEEYHNFASRVYAGIAREGISLDKLGSKFEVQPQLLENHEGVYSLVKEIQPSVLETKINVGAFIKRIEGKYNKQELNHRRTLQKAQDMIEKNFQAKVRSGRRVEKEANGEIKFRTGTPENVPQEYQHIKSHHERVSGHKNVEGYKNAVILMQRLLRGRAAQNQMYEGKEKRLALIEELLVVANVKAKTSDEIQEDLLQKHEERLKDAMLETIQGEMMSRAFDMLSKELLRFKQEKKVNQLRDIAENDRRRREAVEHGKRQAEEILLRREDQLYSEIMGTHQNTVDYLLENLLGNVVDQAASRQAQLLVKMKKEKIDDQVNIIERKAANKGGIIRELVASFLIPNVQREKLQKRVELEERKFTETAQQSLKLAIGDAKKSK